MYKHEKHTKAQLMDMLIMDKYEKYTRGQLIAMLIQANDTIDRITENNTINNGFCLFTVDNTGTVPVSKCLICDKVDYNTTNTTISYCKGKKSN